nr:SDR family NAD(P)-dependent oxidoreductase [Oceanicoccus sp. KOV_DT_Chl]
MSIFDRFRLDGQVAIITGAGRGIGAAIAKAFAEAGADIVLAARTLEQLQTTAAAVEAFGRRTLIVPTDVMVDEQLQHLADQAMAEFGRIDILVNNAGGFPPNPPYKPAPATSIMHSNLTSPLPLR